MAFHQQGFNQKLGKRQFEDNSGLRISSWNRVLKGTVLLEVGVLGRVTNFFQLAQGFLGLETENPTSPDTPQFEANWDAWSPQCWARSFKAAFKQHQADFAWIVRLLRGGFQRILMASYSQCSQGPGLVLCLSFYHLPAWNGLRKVGTHAVCLIRDSTHGVFHHIENGTM